MRIILYLGKGALAKQPSQQLQRFVRQPPVNVHLLLAQIWPIASPIASIPL